uniref:Uncharacterized protein n=1 Tax=Arundo donax TaxID=35708 RepID=A0A0A8ZHG1_ARUDO
MSSLSISLLLKLANHMSAMLGH